MPCVYQHTDREKQQATTLACCCCVTLVIACGFTSKLVSVRTATVTLHTGLKCRTLLFICCCCCMLKMFKVPHNAPFLFCTPSHPKTSSAERQRTHTLCRKCHAAHRSRTKTHPHVVCQRRTRVAAAEKDRRVVKTHRAFDRSEHV